MLKTSTIFTKGGQLENLRLRGATVLGFASYKKCVPQHCLLVRDKRDALNTQRF